MTFPRIWIAVAFASGLVAGAIAWQWLKARELSASAEAALLQADQLMRSQQLDSALQYAFAAVDRSNGASATYQLVGDIFSKKKLNETAKIYYSHAIENLAVRINGPVLGGGRPESVAADRARLNEKLQSASPH